MGKYRLGKNLEGLSEYLDNMQNSSKVLCLTNKSDLNIVFSGEATRQNLTAAEEEKLKEFLDDNIDDYDYIILEAGKSVEVARNCTATIMLLDNASYSPRSAREKIEAYDNEGCLVLGVVLINA